MKRLCFVLTVLFLQIAFLEAFAQGVEGIKGIPIYDEGTYSNARNYLLRATYRGGEGDFFLMEKGGYLYLLPSTQMPDSPEGLNEILWKVTVEKGDDNITGFSYRFRTAFSLRDLVFRSEEATASEAAASNTANRLDGDIQQWHPSSKSGSPSDNLFYHTFSGGTSVIVWGVYGNKVVPRLFKNLGDAQAARDVLTITPCRVEGYIPFSVNDLNTNLGKNGVYNELTHDVRATSDSYFQISFASSGLVPDVLNRRHLQAQGVTYGASEGSIVLAKEAHQVDSTWFSLLVKDQGYIVVSPTSTGALELNSTDKWQDKTSLSAGAYLFNVLYDGNTGQVFVRSKLNPTEDLTLGAIAFYVGGENQYVPATVVNGVYLMQIVGINDNRNSWSDETHPRKGKYLTFLPDGSFAFADYGEHLRKDPAAQWIIEGNVSVGEVVVTNRERGKYSVSYFGDDPSHVFKGSASGTIFFLGTDTLRLVQLTSDCLNDPYAGYHHFVSGLSGSEGFTFKYYQGKGNLGVNLSGGDDYVYITNSDSRIYPEFVAKEAYGYTTPANTALVPLERSIYKLKYNGRYISFDPDVAVNRRYFLQNDPEQAAVFLLKETWRDKNGEQQYQLFNAPYASGQWAEIDDVTGKYIALHTNGVITSGKTLVMAKLVGGSYVPIEYETEAEVRQIGDWVTPIPVKGVSRFYAKYSIPLSWLSVNNTAQSVLNVTDKNYPKGEFAVQDHYPSLYRSLTSENVKEEQEIRIESIFTSATLAPQSTGSSSLSYLAIEDQSQGELVARYVRGVKMPQYLLMSDVEEKIVGREIVRTARFLRSLADSVSLYRLEGKDPEAFLWEDKPRLAFVEGILSDGDTKLTVAGETIQITYAVEEQQIEGESSPLLFSLRLAPEGDGTFLLETRGDVYSYYGSGLNSWIKIINGIPVLHTSTYEEAILEGVEIFTVKSTLLKVADVKETAVKVTASEGNIIVSGVAGRKLKIINLLGKTLINETIVSDETILDIPSGFVVVSVEGEEPVKVLVH
ncbi:MAG: DUF6383 domain-containing protein [Tannerellaceae bacterium]|jgi:hypothetical protein|nr:DUF6383 domain-containing protein [Tannerellaceae bacterium]